MAAAEERLEEAFRLAQFFGYNALGLVLSLIVWHFLPKPPPEDYTTVPGLKSDGSSQAFEMLRAALRAADNFADFLVLLHADYGPVACFHLSDDTQVISVAEEEEILELQVREGKTSQGCCCQLVPLPPRKTGGECAYNQRESAVAADSDDKRGKALNPVPAETNLVDYVMIQFCSELGLLYDFDSVVQWHCTFTEMLTEPDVIRRCNFESYWLYTCITAATFIDLSSLGDCLTSSATANASDPRVLDLYYRLAVDQHLPPFAPHVLVFDSEQDVVAHPIPAGTPIVCQYSISPRRKFYSSAIKAIQNLRVFKFFCLYLALRHESEHIRK